jgi:hypothetical protein
MRSFGDELVIKVHGDMPIYIGKELDQLEKDTESISRLRLKRRHIENVFEIIVLEKYIDFIFNIKII